MLHLANEAEIMMKKLLTCLQHQHRDQIYSHFTTETREDLVGDKWDDKTKRIVRATNEFMEEEDEDDICLEGVQVFMKE